jgi:hypothetical protein
MNLNDMTVTKLRKIAANFDVPGRSTMRKAELVSAIEAAEIAAESVELFKQAYRVPSDHNPYTEGRVAAIDVVGNFPSVFKDAPSVRIHADGSQTYGPYVRSEVESVNVEIERDPRGGRMMYVFTEDGDMQSIRLIKNGRRWETVLDKNYSRIAVKAATLPKLVKAWSKKAGVWAQQIDITV